MADNYLERKMEDYRRGVAPRQHGSAAHGLNPWRVLVTFGGNETGRQLVTRLCGAGCKVAFCDTELRRGRALSQSTGSQFHPVNICDAEALERAARYASEHWSGLDAIIDTMPGATADLPRIAETHGTTLLTVSKDQSSDNL